MSKLNESHQPTNVTPYLIVPHVDRLIQFLTTAFGAEELLRRPRPDGAIQHAEVRVGSSRVMMGEPHSPEAAKPGMLYVNVPSADIAYEAALQAGGTSVIAPADQPYGVRIAAILDPCGNEWWVAEPRKGDLS